MCDYALTSFPFAIFNPYCLLSHLRFIFISLLPFFFIVYRRRRPCKPLDQSAVTRPLMAADIGSGHAPTDPVEMRRLNFQTPGMISHPPIPISELANHIERLKANDNLKFSQEYEVRKALTTLYIRADRFIRIFLLL